MIPLNFRRFIACFLTIAIVNPPAQTVLRYKPLIPIPLAEAQGDLFAAQALASASAVAIDPLSHGKVNAFQNFPEDPFSGLGWVGSRHHMSGGPKAMERRTLTLLSHTLSLNKDIIKQALSSRKADDLPIFCRELSDEFGSIKKLSVKRLENYVHRLAPDVVLKTILEGLLASPDRKLKVDSGPIASFLNRMRQELERARTLYQERELGEALTLAQSFPIAMQLQADKLITIGTDQLAVVQSEIENIKRQASELADQIKEETRKTGRIAFLLESGLSLIDNSWFPAYQHFDRPVRALQEHVINLLSLPMDERRELWRRYQSYFNINSSVYGTAPELLRVWEALNANESYYTSFPAEELLPVRYLRVFHQRQWQEEVRRLRHELPRMTQTLPRQKIMKPIDASVSRLLKRVSFHDDVRDQVTQGLRLALYHELMLAPGKRKALEPRQMKICLNTSRDGQQSNIATKLTGAEQRVIIRLQADLGADIMETWGGVVNQASVLQKIRGDEPEDAWSNLRKQTAILRGQMEEVLHDHKDEIRPDDWNAIFNRYEVREDRQLLSDEELAGRLYKYSFWKTKKDDIMQVYGMKQEMLLRGQYLVGLKSYPLEVQKLFVQTAYKNGVDVFRIFDALNDVHNILPVLEAAKEVGAKVQPVIHYTTDFPLGIPEYVRQAEVLIEASGEALDSLVIKDAGGLLEPDETFDLVTALRTRFRERQRHISLQLHTHDTRGNRQLTLLEAIRANGSEDPIIIDLGVGKGLLSSPFGQPDLRDFLDLVEGTPWGENIHIDREKLAELEKVIASEIMSVDGKRKYTVPSITSALRRMLVEVARMPGGAYSSFIRDFENLIMGYRQLFEERYGISISPNPEAAGFAGGKQFIAALLPYVFEEMRVIAQDAGGISLVTPSALWVYTQAIQNTRKWLMGEWLIPQKTKSGIVIKKASSFPSDRRAEQYALTLDLRYYFLLWAQNKNLERLYPNVNRDMVVEAFRMLGDPQIDLNEVQTALNKASVDTEAINNILHRYHEVRLATGTDTLAPKPYVDSAIVALKQAWDKKQLSRPITRADILEINLQINPSVNIPQTLEELRAKYREIQEKYHPEAATDSDEDFLTWLLYPEVDQSHHLFTKRTEALQRQETLSEEMGVIRTILDRMGLTTAASSSRHTMLSTGA